MKIKQTITIDESMDNIADIDSLDEDYLMEMAVLDKSDSGLPYDLWLDPAARERKNTHYSPRLKVKVGDNKLIPFLIDKDNPDIPESVKKNAGITYFRGFKYVKEYIKEYYDILNAYWWGLFTDKEALNLLGRLGERDKHES